MEETKDQMKRVRTFSKSRYYEIEKRMMATFPDQSTHILDIIKEVFDFDPNASTYNENIKASIDKRRQKLKEQGISTYISSGSKASYYKKKQLKGT